MDEPRQTFSRSDATFVAVCLGLALVSLFVIVRFFGAAFPEASIDLRYDRNASRVPAEAVIARLGLPVEGRKHTAVFESDDTSRIFLERTLGLERANEVIRRRDVKVWYWRHRWFKPLVEEEYGIDIAPTGEIVAFARKLPESVALPALDSVSARQLAEHFLRDVGIDARQLTLVSESQRQLPKRLQRIYTWESKSVRPGGAPYRFGIAIDGNAVTSFSQRLKVPEEWLRSYSELRSKNNAAGNVDTIFLIITIIGIIAVFVARVRRGDLHFRFVLALGAVSVVLVTGVALNSWPSALAGYNTTTSYPAFVAQFLLGAVLQSIGTAMMLVVVCGAGEVLYRESLPQHLAIPKLWTPRALASRRVFRSLILGYSLVAIFIAYQVIFYLIAGHFGAWSPAEVPYDDMLNSAVPWLAVLFAGFFPAFSEEFMSRAFSIPFFHRFVRSRFAAIVIAGFIWGFGHATYPNQPFYIRGVEVGIVGVILGLLMQRFGLLTLLIWHYTVDAVYTALLLIRSGNTYYVVSGLAAALIFAVPLIASIVLLIRNRGFIDDSDLSNSTLPLSPPPAPESISLVRAELPPAIRSHPSLALIAATALATALVVSFMTIESLDSVADYRITRAQAKAIATAHMSKLSQPIPERVIADPVSGFRSWNRESPHEEGGAPAGFDGVAAEHLLKSGLSMTALADLMRRDVPTATWAVRFFTPMKKREYFVEVDPRTSRVVGYHKYEEESTRGAALERPAALAIATAAFAGYGLDPARFTVQDAFTFQQSNRRDWLFHFQQTKPVARDAFRRVSVRVMGGEVTQFTVTVKVPDRAYRDANQETLFNTILSLLKIIGTLAALALIVAGFVIATRKGRLPWKRALLWTAALSVIPIANIVLGYESALFGYNSSVAWETFRLDLITDSVRSAGLQMGALFLAVAGILAVYPHAEALLSRAGRARFGRGALTGAIAALSLLALVRPLTQIVALRWPGSVPLGPVDASNLVAVALPSLIIVGDAIFAAIAGSAAVALYMAAVAPMRRTRWLPALVTISILFTLSLDPGATPRQMAVMLIRSLVMALFGWCAGRYLLGRNLLAWPLAFFLATTIDRAASLFQHHRPDLVVHGTIVAVVVFIVAVAMVSGRERVEPGESEMVANSI